MLASIDFFATSSQKLINSLFLATKSVSEFISTKIPILSDIYVTTNPSAASLELFFAAF